MKKPSFKFVTSVLIVLFSLYFSIPSLIQNNKIKALFSGDNRIRLGLDLQGGSQLLLQVETEQAMSEKLSNMSEEIRDLFTDNEVFFDNIRNDGQQIEIYLESSFEKSKVESLLENLSTINYTFDADKLLIQFKEDYKKTFVRSLILQSLEIVRKRIDEVGTNEPVIQVQGKKRILVQLPGLKDPERIKRLLGKTAKMNFRLVDEKGMNVINEKKYFIGSEIISHSENPIEYVVKKRIGVSGDNLIDANASVDQFNEPVVSIRFDSIGARRFADLTSKHTGERFAIVLDNKVISAPVIREPIPTGNAQISGNFTFETANDLAILLRAGSLPAPISILEERSVGPSLGEDSIKAGTFSVLIALSLVFIYMIFIYGNLGIIANFVLTINFLFIIAWIVLLEATLTLPGIAGIALTVGMAVDANVLVFERIREEKKLGRSKISAINTGFEQALRAILDANVTTLIAAVILFFLGSGPIKGFSITLGLGVLSTITCTIIISRLLIDYFYTRNPKREINI